jgi:hypothetical protein
MSDLKLIARRLLRMIEAKEAKSDVFVRDAGTLAEMVLDKEDQCERNFGHLTDAQILKLIDFINNEKLINTKEV